VTNLSKIQFVGALTASNNTGGTGISAVSSEISIGGALTASSNATGISLSGTRLRGGDVATSITCSSNTTAGLVMIAGASLSTRGAMTMADNAGIGFSAADSLVNINGLLSVTVSALTNVSLTQTTLTVGSLVASTSTAGNGIAMTEARLEADTTVVASSNATANLAPAGSTIIVGTNATFNSSGGSGILTTAGNTIIVLGALTCNTNTSRGIAITDSELTVGTTLTVTGNTAAGLESTQSNLRVGGTATIHGTNGTNVSLISSTMSAANADFSTAASTGTKLSMSSSRLQVTSALTVVTTSGGTFGIAARDSSITCDSITISGNSTNMFLSTSRFTCSASATFSLPQTTAHIDARNGSMAMFGVNTYTFTNTGANNVNAIILTSSTLQVAGTLAISGNYTVPLQVRENGTCVVNIAATITGGASTTNPVRISSSRAYLNTLTTSGSTGGNANVIIQQGSHVSIEVGTISSSSGPGMHVASGSHVRLRNIAGTLNTGTGLLVNGGGKVTFLAGTMTITGASDCTVGVNAAKTWAQMDTGQLQHVNDYSFPAGVAPVVTSVTTMSSCAPE
jgi:hypothetical protein